MTPMLEEPQFLRLDNASGEQPALEKRETQESIDIDFEKAERSLESTEVLIEGAGRKLRVAGQGLEQIRGAQERTHLTKRHQGLIGRLKSFKKTAVALLTTAALLVNEGREREAQNDQPAEAAQKHTGVDKQDDAPERRQSANAKKIQKLRQALVTAAGKVERESASQEFDEAKDREEEWKARAEDSEAISKYARFKIDELVSAGTFTELMRADLDSTWAAYERMADEEGYEKEQGGDRTIFVAGLNRAMMWKVKNVRQAMTESPDSLSAEDRLIADELQKQDQEEETAKREDDGSTDSQQEEGTQG